MYIGYIQISLYNLWMHFILIALCDLPVLCDWTMGLLIMT